MFSNPFTESGLFQITPKLPKTDLARFREVIKIGDRCPACGAHGGADGSKEPGLEMLLAPEYAVIGVPVTGQFIPMAILNCPVCHFTLMYRAIELGLLRVTETGVLEAIPATNAVEEKED